MKLTDVLSNGVFFLSTQAFMICTNYLSKPSIWPSGGEKSDPSLVLVVGYHFFPKTADHLGSQNAQNSEFLVINQS
jgi:hypothetical protein